MKIKMICNLTIFLILTLGLNFSFACPGHDEVARKSYEIAKQLTQLIDKVPHAICAEDIKLAAAFINAAGLQVQGGQYNKALTSLQLGQLELQAITTTRDYCENFTKLIKPFIPEVILVIKQLSSLN